MLVIRSEQLRAFEGALVDGFVARAAQWVAEHHADQARALGADGVRKSVREAIRRARLAGIVDEHGILLYLRAMYERGHEFDREPWAAFLGDPAVEPATKLVELADALRGRP